MGAIMLCSIIISIISLFIIIFIKNNIEKVWGRIDIYTQRLLAEIKTLKEELNTKNLNGKERTFIKTIIQESFPLEIINKEL